MLQVSNRPRYSHQLIANMNIRAKTVHLSWLGVHHVNAFKSLARQDHTLPLLDCESLQRVSFVLLAAGAAQAGVEFAVRAAVAAALDDCAVAGRAQVFVAFVVELVVRVAGAAARGGHAVAGRAQVLVAFVVAVSGGALHRFPSLRSLIAHVRHWAREVQ